MSHYFLCSQNKHSKNRRFFQCMVSDFVAAEFPKTPSPKPPPPRGGGNPAGGGQSPPPNGFFPPCLVRISSFNHLDFARNSFEFCLTNTANFGNPFLKQKWGRREAPTQRHSPRRIQNPKGFSTLRVARRLAIQFYE